MKKTRRSLVPAVASPAAQDATARDAIRRAVAPLSPAALHAAQAAYARDVAAASPRPFFAPPTREISAPPPPAISPVAPVNVPQTFRDPVALQAECDRRSAAYRGSNSPRAIWSRHQTTLWLDDRGPAVLAWLRLTGHRTPATSSARVGAWLKEHDHTLFLRMHATLFAAGSDAARATLHPGDLLA